MENFENALKFYDKEIELHTEKLIQLKQTLDKLTPQAHDLSVEYASTNASEIALKSQEVGMKITELENEINKLNSYIQSLWNSKINCIENMQQDNSKTR